MDVIAPLVGVLMGGLLAICGQFLIETKRERRVLSKENDHIVAIARLQQDFFWTFQCAAGQALEKGCWLPNQLDSRYDLSRDDFYTMAESLLVDSWGKYTNAIRSISQLHFLRANREPVSLSTENLRHLLIAYICADEARLAVSALSRVQATNHRAGGIILSNTDIENILSEHSVRFKTGDRTAEWMRRLTTPDDSGWSN